MLVNAAWQTAFSFLGNSHMEYRIIAVVGIDMSKRKHIVAVCKLGGETVLRPLYVNHKPKFLKNRHPQ